MRQVYLNFVSTVFEQGDEMLILLPMEKQMVECNLKGRWQDWPLVDCLLSVSKDFDLGWFLFLLCLNSLSAERYSCSKFVMISWIIGLCWGLTSQSTIFQSCRDGKLNYCSKCKLLTRDSNSCFRLDCLLWRGRGWGYRKGMVALINNFIWYRSPQESNTVLEGFNKILPYYFESLKIARRSIHRITHELKTVIFRFCLHLK